MPEYTYTGASGRHYTEARDALGVLVGQVEPGDVRDLDEPADGDWTPVAPPAGKSDDGKPARKTATDPKAGVTGKEG